MIRHLYSLALWLAQPIYMRKLARRAPAEPGYAQAVPERFGRYAHRTTVASQNPVWIHAVSLGETRAAAILIKALRQQNPQMRLLLTHGTATGRQEGASLLQHGDLQAWLPWDTPGAVQRFLNHFQPQIGILMETEVWPNLAHACKARGTPLVLANARMSDQSLTKALRLHHLARPAYRALSAVWAQTETDAQRLRQLGARVQGVFGNLKFDASPDPALLAQGHAWRVARRAAGAPLVVMLASSREGEEQLLLEVLKQKMALPQAVYAQAATEVIAKPVQWLIVPRHPQRFDAVAKLIQAQGWTVSRRSQWAAGNGPPPELPGTVWLGDSLGEMPMYYGLAQVALLGGSFAPFGGQNLIEAAACACPVVMGPHTFNFDEAAQLALQAGAALRAPDMSQAVAQARALLDDSTHSQFSTAAVQFSAAQNGATHATVAALQVYLLATPN
jgi:3-deoxy-D-manno-octulosonic-acid transferase